MLTGDLSTQGALVAEWIRAPASCDEVIEPARAARADPLLLVTALPGWAQRDNNRWALRAANAIGDDDAAAMLAAFPQQLERQSATWQAARPGQACFSSIRLRRIRRPCFTRSSI